MAAVHSFNPSAFRRIRLPWLLGMMIPSFAIDLIFLYQVITLNPVAYDDSGRLAVGELLIALAGNAVFLKSGPLIYHFVSRHIRRQGKVTVAGNQVYYHKRLLMLYDMDYPHPFFIRYKISNVESIRLRKSGAIVIRGHFPVNFYDDQKNEHGQSARKRCVIPPYYDGMENIYRALLKLKGKS